MEDHKLSSPAVTNHGILSVGQNQTTSQDPLQPDPLEEITGSIERDRQGRERWHRDYRLAMTELANLFPTMRGVPGTNPWNVEQLIAWMNTGAPTSGSWHAAMFLLGVWNPSTKWNQEGVRMRKGASGKFDLFAAYAVWDHNHIRAMQEWIAAPFWP
jgi:hypothetical protein